MISYYQHIVIHSRNNWRLFTREGKKRCSKSIWLSGNNFDFDNRNLY